MVIVSSLSKVIPLQKWPFHGLYMGTTHSLGLSIILQVQPYKLTTTRFILHPSHPFRDHVTPGLISTVPTHLVESTSSKVLRQRLVKLLSQKKTEIEYFNPSRIEWDRIPTDP